MATEIERKFLVVADSWRDAVETTVDYRQGYLGAAERCTVRVRIGGGRAWLNIKGATEGIARAEFEYPVPLADAEAMLERLAQGPTIEKTRHRVPYGGHVWEVDVFAGANRGLVVAEVELASVEEAPELPPWVGEEVSGDPRYRNAALVNRPFRDWADPRGGAARS